MSKLLRILRTFLSEWNEFLSIPLGLLLFFLFPYLLRFFDPHAGAYDAGVLHSFVAAIVGMLLIHGFAWVLIRITFPGVYRFFDNAFENLIFSESKTFPLELSCRDKHLNLSAWQKCSLSLSLFALYLLGTILLVRIF